MHSISTVLLDRIVGRSRFAENTKTGGRMQDLILGAARIFDSDHLCSPRVYCQRFQRQPWAALALPPWNVASARNGHRGGLTKSICPRMPLRTTKKRLNLLFL